MACCSLCLSICFDELPELPKIIDTSTAWVSGAFHWDYGVHFDPATPPPPGFPYHENLGRLAKSATSCALCALVCQGTDAWMNKLRQAGHFNDGPADGTEDRQRLDPSAQRLGLFKALHLQDDARGLLVATMREDMPDQALILATVGLAVDDGSPLAQDISQRPFQPDSSSASTLSVAASWLKACLEDHQCFTNEARAMPTRILDVGEAPGDPVKLVESTGGNCDYVALSYCWGCPSLNLTTTRLTLNLRQKGFPMLELPQTTQDAVSITKFLGFRFLWVDSLCIVQDDAEDWAQESSRMCNVYANAVLVIAADRAEDAAEGCFHTRPARQSTVVHLRGDAVVRGSALSLSPSRGAGGELLLKDKSRHAAFVQKFHTTIIDPYSWWDAPSEDPPAKESLDRRGWAYQERALARRILHFKSSGLSFECPRGLFHENGTWKKAGDGSIILPKDLRTPAPDIKRMSFQQHDDAEAIAALSPAAVSQGTLVTSPAAMWETIIINYSGRRLTKKTDKLPALSGLARHFGNLGLGNYLVGTWTGDNVVRGLLWEPHPYMWPREGQREPGTEIEPDTYLGPTWSWVSHGDIVFFPEGELQEATSVATVVEWACTPKAAENPWGEVTDAWIRLQAPAVRLAPQWRVENSDYYGGDKWSEGRGTMCVSLCLPEDTGGEAVTSDLHDLRMRFDDFRTWNNAAWSIGELRLLLLGKWPSETKQSLRYQGQWAWFGLVVTNMNDSSRPARLRRIGHMYLDDERAKRILESKKDWETFLLG